MNITAETIDKIRNSVADLLVRYKTGISTAITNEGMVSVALPVKMVQNGERLDVQVGINFVKDRIKDDIAFIVSDQQELFPDGVNLEVGINFDA